MIKRGIIFMAISMLVATGQVEAIDFNKKTYENGLTLLHVERGGIPAVMASLIIDASPLHEPSQKAGLAHLTAKTLTEGTKTLGAKELSEAIDFFGASISSSVNQDYTQLTMSVLKKDIDKIMPIFSEIIMNPSFDEREIGRKKTQIKGQLRQKEEDPSYLSEREFKRLVFGSHPYGRPVEGSSKTLEDITAQDVRDFHRRLYVPHRAILSVVGDITLKEAESLVMKYLGQWKDEGFGHKGQLQKVPTSDQNIKTHIIEKDTTQASIIFGHIGVERSNPDYYALSVMNYILGGGGFASRLMKIVRDELGLTYGINSYFSTNRHEGVFAVEVQTKNEAAERVVEEIKKQVLKMRQEMVSEEELKDAKSFLIGSFPRRLETNRKIADLLVVSQFYRLGDDYIKKYPQYIESVTREDILRVAKKYLHPDKYTLVITGKKDLIKINETGGQ